MAHPLRQHPDFPHTREEVAIKAAFDHAYDNQGQLIVVMCENYQHGRLLVTRLLDQIVISMGNVKVSGFRDGILIKRFEDWKESKIVMVAGFDPGRLMGMHPDKIYVTGTLGEMLYWATYSSAEVIPVA